MRAVVISRLWRCVYKHVVGHKLFSVVLSMAAALRLVTMLGYRPPMLYWYDSFTYLNVALHLRPSAGYQPGAFQPSGYPLVLRLLQPFHSVTMVAAIQHVLGLAIGAMIYVTLRRRALPGWGASLAAVPVLFDASFLRLEHAILPDTLFIFLLTCAITVVLSSDKLSMTAAVGAALLFSAATLVRTVGLPLLIVFVLYLVLRRSGLRLIVIAGLVGLLPLVGYATWFRSAEGRFGLATGDGVALWARTMTFADCSVIKPPAREAVLCPNGTRQDAAGEYVWDHNSAINRAPGGLAGNDRLARSFALRAIAAQPLDYLSDVTRNTLLAFTYPPTRHPDRIKPAFGFAHGCAVHPDEPWIAEARRDYDPAIRAQCSVRPYSSFLVAYQYPAYIPRPFLALFFVVGLAGLVYRKTSAMLPWMVAAVLLVAPVAALDFDHRYVLPVIPFASVAAALAAREFLSGKNERRSERAGERDSEDSRAAASLHESRL